MRWINGLAVALTVVLVWIGAGQLSLLVHGWKLVRR
jgi:low affinity Fe/Cu permease